MPISPYCFRRAGRKWLLAVSLCVICVQQAPAAAAQALGRDEPSLVRGLKAGRYGILMRHALAPGTGDPDNFQLSDCASQRNLSEAGRQQARAIGNSLRARGIKTATVFSSQWCRCLDTAQALNLGEVNQQPLINSFFRRDHLRIQQSKATLQWLRQHLVNPNSAAPISYKAPLILVSHQVNITALTGVFPASGEVLVVGFDGDGALQLLARWPTDV